MDTRSEWMSMLLPGESLTGIVICGLARGMSGIRVDTLPEVCMAVVIVVVITLKGFEPVSCAIDVRAGTVFDTDVSIVVRVDVLIDVVPFIGFAADVDANMWVTVIAVLKLITLPASFEALLLFSRTPFCCWSITVLGCRALQA